MTNRANRAGITIAPLAALSWVVITACASGPAPEPTPLPVSAEADSALRVPCEAAVRKSAVGGQRVYRDKEVDSPTDLIWEGRGPKYPGETGSVRVEFVVDSSGRVDMATLRPLAPASSALFGSVRTFMATARFEPAGIAGLPVAQCRTYDALFIPPIIIPAPSRR